MARIAITLVLACWACVALPIALAQDKAPVLPDAAGALTRGIEAARDGNMAEAARLFRAAADAGDARAQFNLGQLYELGQGVPRDGAQAARLYRLAADQHFPPAQARLARMHWRGTAVPLNPREAFRLANLAAEAGEPEGFAVLGLLYFNGQGVPRNMIEAWYWLSLVERFHPDAGQREWASVSRMRAANSLSLETIEATRRRVDAFRAPAAREVPPTR